MPEFIDIHAHVNFVAFDEDRDAVIKRTLAAKTWMMNVGTQIDTSKKAIEIAHQYKEGVYAIVGLHPVHTSKSYHDEKELGEGGAEFTSSGEQFDISAYEKLARDSKVVAIGECGLDYYRLDEDSIKRQKEIFIQHIELANEVKKPLMLHIRNNPIKSAGQEDAYEDALEILKKYAKVQGNVHFFAGDYEIAKRFFDAGFTISFTGVITFAREYKEVIKNSPLDMIMSETDCPYVSPIPYRGKRNEPLYVSEVVKKIAEIKTLDLDAVKTQLVKNTFRVFNLATRH